MFPSTTARAAIKDMIKIPVSDTHVHHSLCQEREYELQQPPKHHSHKELEEYFL